MSEWPSAAAAIDSYCSLRARSLPAETVEFSVSHAAEKSVPFVRSEPEDGTIGVPAVADTDLVIG